MLISTSYAGKSFRLVVIIKSRIVPEINFLWNPLNQFLIRQSYLTMKRATPTKQLLLNILNDNFFLVHLILVKSFDCSTLLCPIGGGSFIHSGRTIVLFFLLLHLVTLPNSNIVISARGDIHHMIYELLLNLNWRVLHHEASARSDTIFCSCIRRLTQLSKLIAATGH